MYMNLFSCCRLDKQQSFKNSIAHTARAHSKHGKTFSLFLKNMSHRTPSTKQKLIEEAVMELGNAKVSGLVFTYPELLAATNDFNDDCLVGEGGFGRVYKGYIKSIDQIVAIKQLDRHGRQGSREFFSEVLMLNFVEHPNLVKLIGYCVDEDQSILVYEYMPNGSVENHLFDLMEGQEALDWSTRMRIALGAAKGLQYLHEIANPPVIYRDFKTSNILLDAESNPKLSDFGLAKLGPTGKELHVSTRVMGTVGYCAPEYQMTGKLTTKSDVYSFGVVVLELISGRRVIDTARPSEEQNLICWAEPFFNDEGKFTAMADPMLEGNYPVKSLLQALTVAAMCLREDAETRPSMSEVVSALEFLTGPQTGKQISVASTSSVWHLDSAKSRHMQQDL